MISEYKMRNIVWIDAVSPTKEELYDIKERFVIPDHIMIKLTSDEVAQGVISSSPLIYLTLPVPVKRNLSIHQESIAFIVGKKYFITFHSEELAAISKFTHSISADKLIQKTDLSEHPINIFQAVVNEVYEDADQLVQKVLGKIVKVEADLHQRKDRQTLESIFYIKRDLSNLKSSISEHENTLRSFVKATDELFLDFVQNENSRIFPTLSNLGQKLTLVETALRGVKSKALSLAIHRKKRYTRRMTMWGLLSIVGGILFALGSKDSEALRGVEEYRILITLALVTTGIVFIIIALIKQKRWL